MSTSLKTLSYQKQFPLFLISFIFLFSLTHTAMVQKPQVFDYSHREGRPLIISAGSLNSKDGIIPYAYRSLGICESEQLPSTEDTIGEILTGERLYKTGYNARTNRNYLCQELCINNFNTTSIMLYKDFIRKKYFTNWYLDNLPAGLINFDKETKSINIDYNQKIPLGYEEKGTFYIYNHLQFRILLNKLENYQYNVVGFNILPMSIRHNDSQRYCYRYEGDLYKNLDLEKQALPRNGQEASITFSYDVICEYSDITLATRWDNYKASQKVIYWKGICISNSVIIIVALIIGWKIFKAIREELHNYDEEIYELSAQKNKENFYWIKISGDIFRPPTKNIMLLSSLIGSGIQLFCMFLVISILGVFGFLNPEYRINVINIGFLFFCFLGLPGGYISSRFYRFFGGIEWIKNTCLTALLFPGILFVGYFIINIFLKNDNSNAAVSFKDTIVLFFFWMVGIFPVVLVGSFFGTKKKKMESPYKINAIPGIIPEKPFYMNNQNCMLIVGLISFLTILIELSYVMSSLWKHEIYYLATFLWVAFLLFIVVSVELTILVVFLNIRNGDYKWWWRSFLMGASPVIYFVLYSVYYYFSLKIRTFSAMFMYFGLMGMAGALAVFVCGSISTMATFYFLKRIYSSIKNE